MFGMKPVTGQKVNIVIDIVMFVVMAALAVIGFLIRYTLISGVERWEKFGHNVEMTVLGLDRHEWGFIHLVLGILLAVLLVLHIIFHWRQIICLFRRLTPGQSKRYALVAGLAIMSLFILVAPFFLKVETGESVRGQGEGYGRNLSQIPVDDSSGEKEYETQITSENNTEQTETRDKNEVGSSRHKEARTHDIKGYHTIDGLARSYNISVTDIKSMLNIPSTVSENERLGRIRRHYGFTMREVEDCILTLQKTAEEQAENNSRR